MLVVAVFWLGALGLASYAASKSCLTVTVEGDSSVRLVQVYPFSRQERSLGAADFGIATVHESRDDEGYPYFYARVSLKDGSRLDLAEGHDRDRCERTCSEINALLLPGRPVDGRPGQVK